MPTKERMESTGELETIIVPFKTSISDIPIKTRVSKRDPFFGVTKKDPNAVIDAFEEAQGIRKVIPKAKVVYAHITLEPEDVVDGKFLNELMNNQEKYTMITWKDSWDRMTNRLKVFITYAITEKDEHEQKK